MNNNGDKNEKNMVNDQKLEQVSGGIVWVTALYHCPVCQHEETRTSYGGLLAEYTCPCCGAAMKQVPGSVTRIKE